MKFEHVSASTKMENRGYEPEAMSRKSSKEMEASSFSAVEKTAHILKGHNSIEDIMDYVEFKLYRVTIPNRKHLLLT